MPFDPTIDYSVDLENIKKIQQDELNKSAESRNMSAWRILNSQGAPTGLASRYNPDKGTWENSVDIPLRLPDFEDESVKGPAHTVTPDNPWPVKESDFKQSLIKHAQNLDDAELKKSIESALTDSSPTGEVATSTIKNILNSGTALAIDVLSDLARFFGGNIEKAKILDEAGLTLVPGISSYKLQKERESFASAFRQKEIESQTPPDVQYTSPLNIVDRTISPITQVTTDEKPSWLVKSIFDYISGYGRREAVKTVIAANTEINLLAQGVSPKEAKEAANPKRGIVGTYFQGESAIDIKGESWFDRFIYSQAFLDTVLAVPFAIGSTISTGNPVTGVIGGTAFMRSLLPRFAGALKREAALGYLAGYMYVAADRYTTTEKYGSISKNMFDILTPVLGTAATIGLASLGKQALVHKLSGMYLNNKPLFNQVLGEINKQIDMNVSPEVMAFKRVALNLDATLDSLPPVSEGTTRLFYLGGRAFTTNRDKISLFDIPVSKDEAKAQFSFTDIPSQLLTKASKQGDDVFIFSVNDFNKLSVKEQLTQSFTREQFESFAAKTADEVAPASTTPLMESVDVALQNAETKSVPLPKAVSDEIMDNILSRTRVDVPFREKEELGIALGVGPLVDDIVSTGKHQFDITTRTVGKGTSAFTVLETVDVDGRVVRINELPLGIDTTDIIRNYTRALNTANSPEMVEHILSGGVIQQKETFRTNIINSFKKGEIKKSEALEALKNDPVGFRRIKFSKNTLAAIGSEISLSAYAETLSDNDPNKEIYKNMALAFAGVGLASVISSKTMNKIVKNLPTNIKLIPFVGKLYHRSSKLETLESGFEQRRLGISFSKDKQFTYSSPTIKDSIGTKGDVVVEFNGRGLDYNNKTHAAFIDKLYDKVIENGDSPFDVAVLNKLRSFGIDYVNDFNGVGFSKNEVHVLNANAVKIKSKVPLSKNTVAAVGGEAALSVYAESLPDDDPNRNFFKNAALIFAGAGMTALGVKGIKRTGVFGKAIPTVVKARNIDWDKIRAPEGYPAFTPADREAFKSLVLDIEKRTGKDVIFVNNPSDLDYLRTHLKDGQPLIIRAIHGTTYPEHQGKWDPRMRGAKTGAESAKEAFFAATSSKTTKAYSKVLTDTVLNTPREIVVEDTVSLINDVKKLRADPEVLAGFKRGEIDLLFSIDDKYGSVDRTIHLFRDFTDNVFIHNIQKERERIRIALLEIKKSITDDQMFGMRRSNKTFNAITKIYDKYFSPQAEKNRESWFREDIVNPKHYQSYTEFAPDNELMLIVDNIISWKTEVKKNIASIFGKSSLEKKQSEQQSNYLDKVIDTIINRLKQRESGGLIWDIENIRHGLREIIHYAQTKGMEDTVSQVENLGSEFQKLIEKAYTTKTKTTFQAGNSLPGFIIFENPFVRPFGKEYYYNKRPWVDHIREAKAKGHDGFVMVGIKDGAFEDDIVIAFPEGKSWRTPFMGVAPLPFINDNTELDEEGNNWLEPFGALASAGLLMGVAPRGDLARALLNRNRLNHMFGNNILAQTAVRHGLGQLGPVGEKVSNIIRTRIYANDMFSVGEDAFNPLNFPKVGEYSDMNSGLRGFKRLLLSPDKWLHDKFKDILVMNPSLNLYQGQRLVKGFSRAMKEIFTGLSIKDEGIFMRILQEGNDAEKWFTIPELISMGITNPKIHDRYVGYQMLTEVTHSLINQSAVKQLINRGARLHPEHGLVAPIKAGVDTSHSNGLYTKEMKDAGLIVVQQKNVKEPRSYILDPNTLQDVPLNYQIIGYKPGYVPKQYSGAWAVSMSDPEKPVAGESFRKISVDTRREAEQIASELQTKYPNAFVLAHRKNVDTTDYIYGSNFASRLTHLSAAEAEAMIEEFSKRGNVNPDTLEAYRVAAKNFTYNSSMMHRGEGLYADADFTQPAKLVPTKQALAKYYKLQSNYISQAEYNSKLVDWYLDRYGKYLSDGRVWHSAIDEKRAGNFSTTEMREARVVQKQLKDIMSVRGRFDNDLQATQQELADALFNKGYFRFSEWLDNHPTAFGKAFDAIKSLGGAAFLGIWSVSQLIVQGTGVLMSLPRAAATSHPHDAVLVMNDFMTSLLPGMLDDRGALKFLMTDSGRKLYDRIRNSGFLAGIEYSELQKFVAGGMDFSFLAGNKIAKVAETVLSTHDIFWRTGEWLNKASAWLTANRLLTRQVTAGTHPVLRVADIGSTKFDAYVTAEASKMALNLSRVNMPSWSKGVISPLTQFMPFFLKAFEYMFSKGMPLPQRMAVFAAWSAAFGMRGVPGMMEFTFISEKILSSLTDDPSYNGEVFRATQKLAESLSDMLAEYGHTVEANTLGKAIRRGAIGTTDFDFANRATLSGFLTPYFENFNPVDLLGPGINVALRIADGTIKTVADLIRIGREGSFGDTTTEQRIALLKQIAEPFSGPRTAATVIESAVTGELRDKRGRLITNELTTLQQIATIVGISTADVSNQADFQSAMYKLRTTTNEWMVKKAKELAELNRIGDKTKMDTELTEVIGILGKISPRYPARFLKMFTNEVMGQNMTPEQRNVLRSLSLLPFLKLGE